MNPPENCPEDPHTATRKQSELPKVAKTPNDMDKQRKFLELDRKVLRFYCIWDDRDQMFGEVRKFILHVSLVLMSLLLHLFCFIGADMNVKLCQVFCANNAMY